jgi:hypothetical protein
MDIAWESHWHTPVPELRATHGVVPFVSPFPADLFEQLRGIKPMASARDLVAKARQQSALDSSAAMELALEETRMQRASQGHAPGGAAS